MLSLPRILIASGVCVLLFLLGATVSAAPQYRIALGSCLKQDRPQPIWDAILSAKPNLFVFMGDNVYADTQNMHTMWAQYTKLQDQIGYRKVQAHCPVLATWDDHDYGQNDAGADYPMKEASKRLFLGFFGVPAASPVRTRPGVYRAHSYGATGQRVQVILLDTRFFRSPLRQTQDKKRCPVGRYVPNADPNASLLGEAQWGWLRQQLLEPAVLRLIVSSIQVLPEQHCFEKWANFPHQRARLFALIRDTGADGVLFASGDRHLGEISRLWPSATGYPLYELTTSGMNSAGAGAGERNRYRVTAQNFRRDNFGLIEVRWTQPDPVIALQIRDLEGTIVTEHRLRLGELAAPPQPHPSGSL